MNTRTHAKALAITIAAPLCMAASLSVADSDTAMRACVNAFVNTSLSKDHSVAVDAETAAPSALMPRSRSYSIVLTATGKQSGKRLAKATCLVDRDGTIIALNGKPLPVLAAALTAADK